jgi:4-amino-4-deoxy-L-arabinose transferase-like glycosyltransferase
MASQLVRALRRIPVSAWVCAAVAFANAACWAIITPPLQGADEHVHLAYVQYLAETGHTPSSTNNEVSREEEVLAGDLRLNQVLENPASRTIATLAEQRQLEADLARPYPRVTAGGTEAAVEPPLYYALEAIPYSLDTGGTLLGRLQLMRLLSALMGAIGVLFAYLFLREALPGAPWAWTVGGLGVAFTPLLAFDAGTVNPDALLLAVSTALFYCLARAFRRGLTRASAAAIGATVAVGLMSKLSFSGLVPGALLGLALLAHRAARARGRDAYALLGLGAAIGLSPVALYAAVRVGSGHSLLGPASGALSTARAQGTFAVLAYLWQLYLPPLPAMHVDFPGLITPFQIWFKGFIGKYNWLETDFPAWVYRVALLPAGAIAALCARELLRRRSALRDRGGELGVYAAIVVGLMVTVGIPSYLSYPGSFGQFTEPRYFLPLLALLAALLALAARGAGRRWGPVAGALIVVTFVAHDLFSQLLVIARYYG